jgi:hypothetical protein
MAPKNKLLLLTYSFSFNGGAVFSERNYRALCSIFGKENIEIFDLAKCNNSIKLHLFHKILRKIHNLFSKFINFVPYRIFINAEIEKTLIKKSNDYSILFIDRSVYGNKKKKIKENNCNIKIITFFQNVEIDFHKDFGGYTKYQLWKIFCNEKMICKYSDITIALNYRDVQRIKQIYKKEIDSVIPISFPNKKININNNFISNNNLTALFFGSNFPHNTHGIQWFTINVLPFVNIKLQVILKDIEKVNLHQSDKLELLGFVENLEIYIQNADFVIFPIFRGSGMKVKTCEALMYGKNIIGTSEIFEGYSVDFEKVGAKCETAEEFIKAINDFPNKFTSKFNEYSRSVFLEKYTDEITFRKFAEVLSVYNGKQIE